MVRPAQSTVLEKFRPGILTPPSYHVERKRSVKGGPSAGLQIIESYPKTGRVNFLFLEEG